MCRPIPLSTSSRINPGFHWQSNWLFNFRRLKDTTDKDQKSNRYISTIHKMKKICDGKKMSKNMYWSTYVDFKTGKKVDIEADIVYCYNYQQSKEVLEDSEEL